MRARSMVLAIATVAAPWGSGSEAADCRTLEGFTHGSFSSVFELFR